MQLRKSVDRPRVHVGAWLLCLLLLGTQFAFAQEQRETLDAASMLLRARTQVASFHASQAKVENRIRLVYFHPSDREPLDDWRARLSRALDDIAGFYRDEMKRLGVSDFELPLDRDADGYVFHVVRGEQPATDYTYESGTKVEREIRRALGDQIDFAAEHVLAIHGLCRKEDDGRYVFHSPYHGRGSQQNGFCHAADCELLDPQLLGEKDQSIVYTEHYHARKEQTVAKFNSWYLGGLAHELGHGIGLPHDSGLADDIGKPGVALMGAGNHHYREERWGGEHPAYLSLGTALHLIASPLVTGSDFQRTEKPDLGLAALEMAQDAGAVRLRGSVQASVPVYAVVAYTWRPRQWPGIPSQDHSSLSHPALVQDGQFELAVAGLRPGDHRLRLRFLHCNGATRDIDFRLPVDPSRVADLETLAAQALLRRADDAVGRASKSNTPVGPQLIEELREAKAPSVELQGKLDVMAQLVSPEVDLIDLKKTDAKDVFLSDAQWVSATVGWGKPVRNHFNVEKESRNSVFLELQEKFFAKGLYAHSDSKYIFNLDGRWKSLTAIVGLRDGALDQGSAVFVVNGDGKELARSQVLRVGQRFDFKVDVSGVRSLELNARGGEGHVNNSWAIWCDPMLQRN